ncbi:hypothetical protein AYJ57_15790 [Salipiger sp. CCB-MM3]|uniref:hypothetical protein n=1 Tax=Salipiger sp. CCB-MM3 TaxID=1792508 RepID=UPI00080ABF33|nr:hypothetical protein [Salipiger sp. CCB-MM3]ANT61918.1 hypothetical protein AYJ57_15790 [Salipiger sp. CCB-MM3]
MGIFRTVLATSTALALSAPALFAADNNSLYLEQLGNGNSALVKQSRGFGGNDIGTTADPVTQEGDNNRISYNNEYCCNGGVGNNDFLMLDQLGDNNRFSATDLNNSDSNVVSKVLQEGNDNSMNIGHNGNDDGTIGLALQQGDNNHMRLVQEAGSNNVITSAKIVGNNNGVSQNTGPFTGSELGMYVRQYGSSNTVSSASIEGDNNAVTRNPPLAASTFGKLSMFIEQRGDLNIASADVLGSNGNHVWILQKEDGNSALVKQGTSVTSTGNAADIAQTGNGNAIEVAQTGDLNSVLATFTGNGNGVGAMTGDAGTLVSAQSNLTQGSILQDSALVTGGNAIDYAVFGNDNLFAFAQIGGDNVISGTVGDGMSNASANQVAVLQVGDGNVTGFSQMGGNNVLAVVQ